MIGIVTPYKINNYGTKLQAYAMQQLMRKYDDAELLGFVPGSDYRINAVIGKLYLKTSRALKTRTVVEETVEMKRRAKVIAEFDKNYYFGNKVKGNNALKVELQKYDSIVCGSDQLWAPSNVIADYFTLTIIPDHINKFSYAASFGVNQVPVSLKSKYKRYLSRLNAISVREEQGKNIVKAVSDKDAQIVLDPTFMLEADEWESISQMSSICELEPYIFCYFLGTNLNHRKFAEKLAKDTGKKLVTFPHFKVWNEVDVNFGDERIYEAGPAEFVKLIHYADYICTDSFHGTVFSIIFNRQVAVFERFQKGTVESTNSRIYNLLKNLGMEDRLYTDETDVNRAIRTHIDYETVNEKLRRLKEKSFQFLDGALRIKRRTSYD